jgi:hypothetical protein
MTMQPQDREANERPLATVTSIAARRTRRSRPKSPEELRRMSWFGTNPNGRGAS